MYLFIRIYMFFVSIKLSIMFRIISIRIVEIVLFIFFFFKYFKRGLDIFVMKSLIIIGMKVFIINFIKRLNVLIKYVYEKINVLIRII